SPVLYSSLLRRPPISTLFPYTTLFRSLRREGEPDAGADVAAPLLRGDGRRLPARSAARVARGALPRYGAGALARRVPARARSGRSEEHTSELQSRFDLVCRLLLEKKKH